MAVGDLVPDRVESALARLTKEFPTISRNSCLEAKSGLTVASDFFRGIASLEAVAARLAPPQPVRAFVVYGGDQTQQRTKGTVVAWSALDAVEVDGFTFLGA